MRRTAFTLWSGLALMSAARLAAADPHSVLVLKAEGTADAAARGRVETEIMRLAKNLDGNVVLGEITYTDAAAATGCKPDAPTCRDEVMTTLSVDEIVIPTANASGNELHIDVKRVAKGQPAKDSGVTVAASDSADAIIDAAFGPMFGVKAKPAAPAPAPKPPTPAIAVQTPPTPTEPTAGSAATPPPPTPAAEQPAAPAPAPELPPPAPPQPSGSHVGLWFGVVGGTVLLGVGIGLWAAANQTESQIQQQPTTSTTDIQKLRNLENTGDGQATGGNLLFVAGVAVAGISAFYLWRAHRHHGGTQTSLAPMAGPHAAGLTLTIGGQP